MGSTSMTSVPCFSSTLKPGTMMIQEGLPLPKGLLETDAYSRGWRTVKIINQPNLGRALDVAGWHLFFVVGRVTAVAFGLAGDRSRHKAVQRIAAKVRALNLNCLELIEIGTKHFLGVPYIAASAHTYHIQQGWRLQSAEERRHLQANDETG